MKKILLKTRYLSIDWYKDFECPSASVSIQFGPIVETWEVEPNIEPQDAWGLEDLGQAHRYILILLFPTRFIKVFWADRKKGSKSRRLAKSGKK